jgi:arabinose-5-phosphate isomerase
MKGYHAVPSEELNFETEKETGAPLAAPAIVKAPANEFDPAYVPDTPVLEQAKQVLRLEAEAVAALADRLGDEFIKAIDILSACKGKVVVTGMGKSGHIGTKIAATFASTGTPAFFVHPAELRHGDFGMIDERDVVVALSTSGETAEIKLAIEPMKRLGLSIIAITGNLKSTLAQYSSAILDVGVTREACALNLAPTSSTTAALAMGDALAMVLMNMKGFKADDFARSHPGGALGQQLLTVKDVMRSGVDVPAVFLGASYADVLQEITKKRLGFTVVLNTDGSVAGMITDGDLRRTIISFGTSVFSKQACEIMTRGPKTISAHSLAKEALKIMEKFAISDLLILDDNNRPFGLIDLKDLLKAGLI